MSPFGQGFIPVYANYTIILQSHFRVSISITIEHWVRNAAYTLSQTQLPENHNTALYRISPCEQVVDILREELGGCEPSAAVGK